MDNEVLPACSWYAHRFNVVPFGEHAHHMPAQFLDALGDCRSTKTQMLQDGAEVVYIYDTVEGIFFD